MNPLRRWGICGFLVAAVCVQSNAREIIYTNLNCAITYPTAWRHYPVTQSNYIALVKNEEDDKTVIVQVRAADPSRWPVMNEQWKLEGRAAINREGVLTKERSVTADGVVGWETIGWLWFEGKKVSTVSRIYIADGKAYKINTMFMEGDAATETNLQATLNSFRFLTPPPPPPSVDRGPVLIFLLGFGVAGVWAVRRMIRKVRQTQNAKVPEQT